MYFLYYDCRSPIKVGRAYLIEQLENGYNWKPELSVDQIMARLHDNPMVILPLYRSLNRSCCRLAAKAIPNEAGINMPAMGNAGAAMEWYLDWRLSSELLPERSGITG